MSKKKKDNKKIKFVCFKHFEIAIILRRMRASFEDMKNVPYYKAKVDDKGCITSLNIFKEEGTVNINKVKFIKITVPKNIFESINLSAYNKKDIKIVKPEQNFHKGDGLVGVMISIELFELMLTNYGRPKSLSTLLFAAPMADSIKLLNKDKEFIAYLLPSIDLY